MYQVDPELVKAVVEAISQGEGGASTPTWLLLMFLLGKWLWQEKTNRTGPSYLKNGTMEGLIDKIGTKIGKEVGREVAVELRVLSREIIDAKECPLRAADYSKRLRRQLENRGDET